MCVGKHKNNVSNTNRGRRILSGRINAYKDVVNKPALWMGKLPETGVRLHLFTTLWVCFIKNVDINLFSNGKPKTGTKLIGIWLSRKNTQCVLLLLK